MIMQKPEMKRLREGHPIIAPSELPWEKDGTANSSALYVERNKQIDSIIEAVAGCRLLENPAINKGLVISLYTGVGYNNQMNRKMQAKGLAFFTPDLEMIYRHPDPVLLPADHPDQIDYIGVEDVRLTYTEGRFYAWYCGYDGYKGAACAAWSEDLLNWVKLAPLPGDINRTDNKDHVIFPRQIDDRWWMLHRPWGKSFSQLNDYVIRLAESKSPEGPWYDRGELLRAAKSHELSKIWSGAGTVPIDIGNDRFLIIYHTGAYIRPDWRQYSAAAAIFDFSIYLSGADPSTAITHRVEPFMLPQTDWEINHELGIGIIFPMGSYIHNSQLYIVYGAGDRVTCAVVVDFERFLKYIESHPVNNKSSFFGDGIFEWQTTSNKLKGKWNSDGYNEEKYWGGFSQHHSVSENDQLPDWAIGPFEKYEGNPIFVPAENGWDRGHISGGVHNGSIIHWDNNYYYVYRGEQPLEQPLESGGNPEYDYICDIGLAISDDGIHFQRDLENSPFFRSGEDAKYSFEDVNLVRHGDEFYLFCNRWDWNNPKDPIANGAFLAVSHDLRHWDKKGLLFPNAKIMHRNPCVVQNPENYAARINGHFIMYLNNGLIATSDDLIQWTSEPVEQQWPGGEGCFALADYSKNNPEHILLFTGGHHTGQFYAIGEVLFNKNRPGQPLDWLQRPVLHTEPAYPWENGYSYKPPYHQVSRWRNTIFFTGMTHHNNKWWLYYGGSEYYTCLAWAQKEL